MVKYFSCFLLFIFLCTPAFSQSGRPIPQQVEKLHELGADFKNFEVFTLKDSESTASELVNIVEDAATFKLKNSALNQILSEKPKTISLQIPLKDSFVEVELYQKNIFTDSFGVYDQDNEKLDYTPGVYYRGIVKNNPNSVVAFSFFRNDASGVISIGGEPGNIVVGKLKNSDDFISYSDYLMNATNPFTCEMESLPTSPDSYPKPTAKTSADEDFEPCVRIYYEIAHAVYLENHSNADHTLNWLTSIHNNINTLYENDDLNISLNEIMIWLTPDTYTGDPYGDLDEFAIVTPNFNGDLGHLINTPSSTSLAYVDSICFPGYNYAYSGVSMSFQNVPTYSWTIMAMSHEMGHALGSPHTHSCSWNGDNTPIDVCAPTFDFYYSEGCDEGPVPYEEGGTIMSYCHLLDQVGINFSNGFGSQPADLMRTNMTYKYCLGTNCVDNYTEEYCFPVVSNNTEPITHLEFGEINNPSDVTSPLGYEDFTEISTQVERGETYEIKLQGFTGGNYTSYFTVFIDFDEDGQFDVEEESFFVSDEDSLFIENSTGTDDIVAVGYITIPEAVSLGEKRMRVIKNYGQPLLNPCDPVGFGQIEDYTLEVVKNMSVENSVFNDFQFYPNPAGEYLNLKSTEAIQKIEIFNLLGQKLKEISSDKSEIQLKLDDLLKGVYLMKVDIDGKTKTYKLLKK